MSTPLQKSIELQEQRARVVEEARRNWTAAGEKPTPEAREAFDKAMSDADKLRDDIEIATRNEFLDREEKQLAEKAREVRTAPHRQAINVNYAQDETTAFNNWFRRAAQVGGTVGEADERWFPASSNKVDLTLPHLKSQRALSEGSPSFSASGAGYLVPVIVPNQIEVYLKFYANLRNFSQVIATPDGRPWSYPRADPTGISSPTVAEGGTYGESDPTFTNMTLSAFKFANSVLISRELIADSIIDVVPIISEMIGEGLGRGEAAAFETNANSYVTNGLVNSIVSIGTKAGPTQGVSAAVVTLTFDSVINCLMTPDRSYQGNDQVIGCSNGTLNALMLVKDTQNRYIYSVDSQTFGSVLERPPEKVHGRQVVVLESMKNFSDAGHNTFLCTWPARKFVIRDCGPLTIEVNPWLNMNTGQIAIFGTQRCDSNYIGPSTSCTT